MVMYLCSNNFEEEFFPFLFETQYIEYLAQEINDKNALNNLEKIFNCIIDTQIVPRCKFH